MTWMAHPWSRRLTRAAVALSLATLAAEHSGARLLRVDVSSGYQSEQRIAVAPGVFHDRGTIQTTTAGRQAVYLLEADATEPALVFEASMSNDRTAGLETTSAQANRKNTEGHRAVGGINADFWGGGDAPIGLHVQNGELFVDGQETRPTFGVEADGDPVIDTATVTSTATRPDGGRYDIARINQNRSANLLVLYTARFAGSTGTDNTGTEVVLSGMPLPIAPTGVYSGTVAQVRSGAGNTPIAAGDVVLSGHGPAATFLNALAVGARVEIATSITAGWGQVVNAVGGGHWLVRNGQVASPPDPGFADVTHPRTGIGVTADGRVIMAVVDGRQPGYSVGVTLPELAQLMISRGAVTAINLDGGGSSTMAVRTPAYDGVTVVNRPSDGFERSVSNSLLVFSTATTGPVSTIVVEPSNATVLAGSHIQYSARGHDGAYNAVAIPPGDVAWSASGPAGTIDGGGRFAAVARGESTVTATAGGVTGSTRAFTVDALASVEVRPNPAIVEPGASQPFSVSGRDATGTPVRVDATAASWGVSGPIGTIDGGGVLTASSGGTGFVTAAAGGASGSARVDIGRAPFILEDFEDISDMIALSARGTATLTSAMRPDPVRAGTRSARFSYNFTNSTAGTSAAYAAHSPWRPIDSRPKRIGVWLYGDGSRHWVRGNYRDGNGSQKVVSFTGAAAPIPTRAEDCAKRSGGIDWVGWKYLEASIPVDAILPLRWERIYIVETVDLCDNSSAIYLDDLRAVYSDTGEDLVGPSVTELVPEPDSKVHVVQPEVGGTIRDNAGGSGVAPDSIRLLIDDQQVPVSYDVQSGRARGTPASPLAEGQHRARLEALDNAGNPALPFGDWRFTVYTGPDVEAPIVDRAQPLNGTVSRAGRPRVSARIRDLYRGVNPATVLLLVDGFPVSATWDAEAGVVWWAPEVPLSDGSHSVILTAADRETPANVATATWSFTVQALAAPAAPFRITWLADGGYFEGTKDTAPTAILGEHLTREAQQPPQLLVFGGDLVENDQQANYDRAVAALDRVPAPRLVAIGNHEISGTLSRERFWRTFGPTIAAADVGPVAILLVDTATSRLDYDSSQFAWIAQELARGTARTVLIALHVPTRDPFGSGHGLPSAEGRRLEAIFADAAAARPDRTIIVLSGDAHAYKRWEQDGVTYVISGGAGGGPDAPPESGGFYHRLHVAVDAAGAATLHVVPLFEAAAVEPSSALMPVGEQLALAATGDVFTATAPDMMLAIVDPLQRLWTTSNASVAAVDPQTGVVRAMSPGEAAITVSSGGAAATTMISVFQPNRAPVAVDDAFTTSENTALNVAAPGVLGNDSDADGDAMTASLVSGPANGTLTFNFNADGSFGYAPDVGFVGTDTFSYRAADGEAESAPATVSITVVPVPQPAGRVTGSGAIGVPGGTASFNFSVRRSLDSGGPVSGELSYYNAARGLTVAAVTIDALSFATPVVAFSGTCLKNGVPCTFKVTVEDNGTPGRRRDRFTIAVSGEPREGTDPIIEGNVTIHK